MARIIIPTNLWPDLSDTISTSGTVRINSNASGEGGRPFQSLQLSQRRRRDGWRLDPRGRPALEVPSGPVTVEIAANLRFDIFCTDEGGITNLGGLNGSLTGDLTWTLEPFEGRADPRIRQTGLRRFPVRSRGILFTGGSLQAVGAPRIVGRTPSAREWQAMVRFRIVIEAEFRAQDVGAARAGRRSLTFEGQAGVNMVQVRAN